MAISKEFKDAVLLGAKLRINGADHHKIINETGLSQGRVCNYFYGGVLPKLFSFEFTEEELSLIRQANKHQKRYTLTTR